MAITAKFAIGRGSCRGLANVTEHDTYVSGVPNAKG